MNAFTRISSVLLLSLGLAACSASMGPADSIDQVPGTSQTPTPESFEIAGTYEVTSHFQVTPQKLGTSGDFALDLEAMADDPIQAISDILCDEAGIPGFLSGVVAGEIEDALGDNAIVFSNAISDFLTASLNFDVTSEMTITGSGRDLMTTDTPVGLSATIDGETYTYSFGAAKADALESFTMTATDHNLEVSSHDVVIPYSQMLVTVLNEMVVPRLDATADDLGDALNHLVDCDGFGTKMDGELGLGASAWRGICVGGVDGVAHTIESKISDIDGLTFAITIEGRGTALDNDRDSTADVIDGSWDSKFLGDIENSIPAAFHAVRK